MNLLKLKPPRIAMGLLGISLILHFSLSFSTRLNPMGLFAGSLLFFLGFGILTWAWMLFKTAATAICPIDTPTQAVTGGPYRITRNPMYLGMLIMLAGVGLAFGTLPFLMPPLLFFLVINFVFIPHEETRMKEIFGKGYEQLNTPNS